MPYVQRKAGAIVGLYNRRQAGFAEEFLPDEDIEVGSFLAPAPPSVGTLTAEELADILIDNPGKSITRADITAKKAARS